MKAKRPLLMGILNVTPDSFSDGGKFNTLEKAVLQGLKMADDGADIIDVGGESTRPGSQPVEVSEEIKRVVPVIKNLKKRISIPISVDTYKSEVARAAIDAGAEIINDITALNGDKKMGELAAKNKVTVVLMHMQGSPATMQLKPKYKNVVQEIILFLKDRIEKAKEYGIKDDRIVIDPGIGFGKTVEHNLKIIKNLKEFAILKKQILIGPSRKSFIGKILDLDASQRCEGSAAAISMSVANGANIVRVHDIKEMKRVVEITWRICSA